MRTSIELPAGTGPEQIRALRVRCFRHPMEEGAAAAPDPQARIHSFGPLFFLDRNFLPGPAVRPVLRGTLKPGQKVRIDAKGPWHP